MNLRSLPRTFLPGVDITAPFELPKDELDKLRKVLRLDSGASILVMPNDGSALLCELDGKLAIPKEVHHPESEPSLEVTIAQALPKADKVEEIVRSCTEMGVSRFLLFTAERTIVRWDAQKMMSRIRRLEVIARESAELSFRMRIPRFDVASDLATVLKAEPKAIVLSESEAVSAPFKVATKGIKRVTIVVGPEGGWSPKENELIGDRAVTLGPLVLRVEHAAAAAAAILLLR